MKKRGNWLTDYDLHLLAEGTHFHSYDKLGAHLTEQSSISGVQFTVWAPNAKRVSVVGDFNNWDELANPLEPVEEVGCWTLFIPGVPCGSNYKYAVYSNDGQCSMKVDPYAFHAEVPPKSASVVWDLDGYHWKDTYWVSERKHRQSLKRPISIYEVHLGSWMRKPEEGGRYLTYRELAERLVPYLKEMGFTHVEFLPLTEHPYSGSWGYQAIGYFAATSRFGTPQDLMYLIDVLHQHGIGVLMDWVPGHFPMDAHGLASFDGTHLYEHADVRQGFHAEWGTHVFNFGRREVANFLISSALFWIEKFHLDGLRVDAVSSMLYLDYERAEGQWIPNEEGGRENLEAVAFLKKLNEIVHERFPHVMMIAEESTAWPMVTRPASSNGLGFSYKWNMGWMNDILSYMGEDPEHRKFHHTKLSFGMLYAYHENFILPFSHDEVVHGKRAMLSKMPGDEWRKFANLRAVLGLMFAFPGKKLMFMGTEFGQWNEWNCEQSLDWHLLEYGRHQGIRRWVKDLNHLLRKEPALFEADYEPDGFRWVEVHDSENSVLSFTRHDGAGSQTLLCVFNFTPTPHFYYRLGVDRPGYFREILNSDAGTYGGSGIGNMGGVSSERIPSQGRDYSVKLSIPPLAAMILKAS